MSLLAAATEALYWEHILAKTGDSIMAVLLGDSGNVTAWQHYPDPDAYDPDNGSQFYYHCHDAEATEHGHFHCFVRPQGIDGPLHHLVALSVDHLGRPCRLFTVNGWVTGADWLDAEATTRLLPNFDPQLHRPAWPICRWITALLTLYRAEIRQLLIDRDRYLDILGGRTALEDRGYAILSQCAIDLPARFQALRAVSA